MNIRTEIKLTAAPYSSAAPMIPTVEVWIDSITPAAHREVVAAAHMLAAALWLKNEAMRPIAVDVYGRCGAKVTVETLSLIAEEREEVMRELAATVREFARDSGWTAPPKNKKTRQDLTVG